MADQGGSRNGGDGILWIIGIAFMVVFALNIRSCIVNGPGDDCAYVTSKWAC